MCKEQYQNTIFSKVLFFMFLVELEARWANAPVADNLLLVEIHNFIASLVQQGHCP